MNKNFILKLNKLNNVKQKKNTLERLNASVKPRNEHTIIRSIYTIKQTITNNQRQKSVIDHVIKS